MLLSFSSGSPHQNFSCVLAGICLLAVLACADTLEVLARYPVENQQVTGAERGGAEAAFQ